MRTAMSIVPDPEYDFIPPCKTMPEPPKRGRQCGQCGLKVDYNLTMGYCCGDSNCPMGFGPNAFLQPGWRYA